MLPKSLGQANAPTSQAGGTETQSQGDPWGYNSGVCIIAAPNLTILMPWDNLKGCVKWQVNQEQCLPPLPGLSLQGSLGMFQFLAGLKICSNYLNQEFWNRMAHSGSVHSYFPWPILPHLLFINSFLRIAEKTVTLSNSDYDKGGQKAKLICKS